MDSDSKKFKIITLGCRTNQYESQAYQDQLDQMGYSLASSEEEANLCIVNTCTVTDSADSSSRHEIRRLKRENPNAKIVVTGCFAERDPKKVEALEVDHIVPNKDKENLLAHVFPQEEIPEFSIKRFEAHTRAFVKVQDGCNSYCSYCIIPYVRGRSRSRPTADVLKEVQELIQSGFKEIVLTGINIGDFDGGPDRKDNPERLADLIRAVDKMPGLERLRVSSIDPDEVDEDLADAILNGKKTCPSMHIVLQSGSNVILKRMNRKYTRQIFIETIDKLRQARPDFTFTTDIIVGFPGETDVDFQDTLDVMEYVKFSKVHMFPFSERPRTRAAIMPNKVPSPIIKERKQEVLRLAEKYAYQLRDHYVGQTMQVLTESEVEGHKHCFSGHTANFLPVIVEKEGLSSNQLLEVKCIANSPLGLIGKCYEN